VVNVLFPHFLTDPDEYLLVERYWRGLWDQVDPLDRATFEWSYPWLGTGSPAIKDGNPIFSAYSPILARGVRIIQEEPIRPELEFHVWLDTFGGDITEPDRIHELVISCVLSSAVPNLVLSLLAPWIQGHSISFEYDEAGLLLPSSLNRRRCITRRLEFAA